jgi:hypothetical protein
MEDGLYNLIEFAIEECTLLVDLDDQKKIDEKKLIELLMDIIERRETALKRKIKLEVSEAVKKILTSA